MTSQTTRVRVYSGLSLSTAEVANLLPDAEVYPPVKFNEIYTAVKEGVDVIAIVDGEFFQSQAVSPSEIMDALRAGVKVYGSSSMGALRASELHHYGMVGVGRIFEMISSTPYFKDDHLGQSFDPISGETFSTPLVDLSANLESLVGSGEVSSQEAAVLYSFLDNMHYTDRELECAICKLKASEIFSEALESCLKLVFDRKHGSQKKRDAVALLKRIVDDLTETSILNERILAYPKPSPDKSFERFYH